MSEACISYKYALKVALDATRIVFAEMDGCEEKDVPIFHPDEYELEIEQLELL